MHHGLSLCTLPMVLLEIHKVDVHLSLPLPALLYDVGLGDDLVGTPSSILSRIVLFDDLGQYLAWD